MTEQSNEKKSPKQEKQVPLVERWANDPNPCGFSTPAPKKTNSLERRRKIEIEQNKNYLVMHLTKLIMLLCKNSGCGRLTFQRIPALLEPLR